MIRNYPDLKYTGKDLDEDTGLYYYNARWYDAGTGRFISEDPARDGQNWFIYVSNNPQKFIDPTGMWTMPSIKDLVGLYANHSRSASATIIKAASGNEKAKEDLTQAGKGASVEFLRDTASASSIAGDVANYSTVGLAITGNLPGAGTAATAALMADGASLLLNAGADIIEGELSADTTASMGSFAADVIAKKTLPSFNTGSMRFHKQINPGRGQFVSTKSGTSSTVRSSFILKVASIVGSLVGKSQVNEPEPEEDQEQEETDNE